jgi:Family of unknown function (DUF6941)
MALEVLHLILCERVESDPSNYHRLNIFGLITSIRSSAAPPFPVRHAKMRALIVWSGGQGAGELELQIVDEISAKAVFRSRPRRVRFVGDSAAVGGVVFVIQNCVFPHKGLYWVEVLFSGQVIGRQRLFVRD